MLYQTDLYLAPFDDSDLHSDIAVKIHGAVMKTIPTDYASQLHVQQYHPFSIFAAAAPEGYIVRVSALNGDAKVIVDATENLDKIIVFGCNRNRPVQVLHHSSAPPVDGEVLESLMPSAGCRIDFVTPAVIKTGGRPSARPDICSYFYSVLMKYNEFEQQSADYADVQAAFQAAQFGDYRLESARHNVSGHIFSGMTGFCELMFPKEIQYNQLLRRLIAYASYCGIGAKTGQGMGGITIQNI